MSKKNRGMARSAALLLPVPQAVSGSSGKSCRPRQQGDSGRATRPVSAALAPDKGMAMCIPVDSGAVDRIGDLVPGLKPPARQRQRTQDLPPGLDQVEIGRILGLEHHLPAWMPEQ